MRTTKLVLLSIACFGVHQIASAENLTAQQVRYTQNGKMIIAQGQVQYADPEYQLTAASLVYDTTQDQMTAKQQVHILIKNFADGKDAWLTADEVRYDKHTEALQAAGHVIISYDGKEAKAEQLSYDRKGKTILLSGNVIVKDRENQITGQKYVYDSQHKSGEMTDFIYTFDYNGVHYHSEGKHLLVTDQKTTIQEASLTTCNELHPHYYFYVKQAEFFPGKKLVLNKTSYYQDNHKAFTMNQMVIGLHGNEPVLPEAGYDADDGWYVKTKQYYDLTGKDYGIVYKDVLSARGIGLGFREYHFGSIYDNQTYLYRSFNLNPKNETLRGEWLQQSKGEYQLFSFRRDDNRYNGNGTILSANYNFAGNHDNVQSNMLMGYQLQTGINPFSQFNTVLGQSIRNTDRLRTVWNYTLSRSGRPGQELQQDHSWAMTEDYTAPSYSAQLYLQKNKYGLDTLPRLLWQSNFQDSPLQYEVSTSRITRNYSDFGVNQTDLKTTYNGEPHKISKQSFLSTDTVVDRTLFDDGNNLISWKTNVNMLTNISPKLYTSLVTSVGHNGGYNPVSQLNTDQNTKETTYDVHYQLDDDYSMVVSAGYDVENKKRKPYSLALDGRTFPFWNWSIATSYDPVLHSWNKNSLYVTLNPHSHVTGYINATYDDTLHKLTPLTIRLESAIAPGWKMNIRSDYDAANPNATAAEFSIVRTIHCRELSFSIYPHDHMFYIQWKMINPTQERENHA